MTTITKNNNVITAITIFTVEAKRQQELVDTLITFAKTLEKQPGFISASLYKSLDGTHVADYAQWKSQQDYETFMQTSEVLSLGKKLSEFTTANANLYEVAIVEPKGSITKISKDTNFISYFAVFEVKPENQQRLLNLAQENVLIAIENPGLVSANFHRSLDGTKVINFGQWRSQADFEALVNEPKYAPLSQYHKGIASEEVHLYELAFILPTD